MGGGEGGTGGGGGGESETEGERRNDIISQETDIAITLDYVFISS